MVVLAIDTAGPVVGVALLRDESVGVRVARATRGSDGLLLPWAIALCEEAGLTLRDVDVVGVAQGPGAFTGLRVGLATAVGLGLSLDVPVWAGSSLEARARRVGAREVLALLDARKGRVYAGLWRDGGQLHAEADVAPEEAISWVGAGAVATGEGAVVYAGLVAAAGCLLAEQPDHPAVDQLAWMAREGVARGEGVEAARVTPVYLRGPDARPSGKGRIRRGT